MSRLISCSIWALLLLPGVLDPRIIAEERTSSQAATLMAQTATHAYRNAVDEFENHQGSLESVYRWSRRMLAGNLLAASNSQARRDAYRAHVARMKHEYDIISVLFRNGRRGGEADKEAGLRFYLAEANLLLLRNSSEGKPTKESIELASKEAQKVKDAAQAAVEATDAAYLIGTVPLDQKYVWSKHLLDATLEVVGPNEQNRAYSDHRDRMSQISAEVSEKHRLHMAGGEADNYMSSLFYIVEADVLLSNRNGQPGSKDVEELAVVAKNAYQEIAKLYDAGKTDIDTLCLWSSRWMQAVVKAEDKETSRAAYRDHRERIKKADDELASLPKSDRRTSADSRQAAQFFLAEAELLVSQNADANQSRPAR